MIHEFKINTIGIKDKDFARLPFGRQIEYHQKIKEFCESAKSVHISQKHRTHKAAMKEFRDLYNPTEYYCKYEDSSQCRDDSFQVFYK